MLALMITFVALIALQRVSELLLSPRHERALMAKEGAYERGAGYYPAMVGLRREFALLADATYLRYRRARKICAAERS